MTKVCISFKVICGRVTVYRMVNGINDGKGESFFCIIFFFFSFRSALCFIFATLKIFLLRSTALTQFFFSRKKKRTTLASHSHKHTPHTQHTVPEKMDYKFVRLHGSHGARPIERERRLFKPSTNIGLRNFTYLWNIKILNNV